MAQDTPRVCLDCGVSVVLNGKSWPRRCPDHRESHRRSQARRRVANWRKANPGQAEARALAWAAAHREDANTRSKAWRIANPERVRVQPSRQPNAKKASNAAYYAANREREIQRALAYARGPGREAKRARDSLRYALTNGAVPNPTERFTLDEIFERDKRTCQLCGLPVDRADATMDHVVPVTRGGPHTRANVQLAHRSCNTRKGNRM